eukprot:gene21971-28053_t
MSCCSPVRRACLLYQWCTMAKSPASNSSSNGAFPLLVTGLGGSGSHYLANTLRGAGFEVSHEELDKDGAVSWIYAANDFTLNVTYPHGPIRGSSFMYPRFRAVYHVVRSPLAQISSFTSHTSDTYHFVMRWAEAVLREDEEAHLLQAGCPRGASCHLNFAALSWLHWNRVVKRSASRTYRVENTDELFVDICKEHRAGEVDACLERIRVSRDQLKQRESPQHNKAFHFSSIFNLFTPQPKLFHSSTAHKQHSTYMLSDICLIDSDLCEMIASDAVRYGYNREEEL